MHEDWRQNVENVVATIGVITDEIAASKPTVWCVSKQGESGNREPVSQQRWKITHGTLELDLLLCAGMMGAQEQR